MDDLTEISSQYYAGMQTCRDELPFNTEASEAWQKGWRASRRSSTVENACPLPESHLIHMLDELIIHEHRGPWAAAGIAGT
jgi:hypothetical protein